MRVAADLVLAVHLAFVLFVVLGSLLTIWRRWAVWLHIPAVLWGVAVEFSGWICPLTPLENALLRSGGGTSYQGDFLSHYLLRVLYPQGLTRTAQFMLGGFALVVNALLYTAILLNTRKGRTSRRSA
jgi:hypothetical protein